MPSAALIAYVAAWQTLSVHLWPRFDEGLELCLHTVLGTTEVTIPVIRHRKASKTLPVRNIPHPAFGMFQLRTRFDPWRPRRATRTSSCASHSPRSLRIHRPMRSALEHAMRTPFGTSVDKLWWKARGGDEEDLDLHSQSISHNLSYTAVF